jgi:hypothetical protein
VSTQQTPIDITELLALTGRSRVLTEKVKRCYALVTNPKTFEAIAASLRGYDPASGGWFIPHAKHAKQVIQNIIQECVVEPLTMVAEGGGMDGLITLAEYASMLDVDVDVSAVNIQDIIELKLNSCLPQGDEKKPPAYTDLVNATSNCLREIVTKALVTLERAGAVAAIASRRGES